MPKERFRDRLQHAWNAFTGTDNFLPSYANTGYSSFSRPDRTILTTTNERSIITALYNRIATDVSNVNIHHARLDENGRYLETIESNLNSCFRLDANIDQTGRELVKDAVLSMFDEGCVAIIPIETTLNPSMTGGYDITNLRVGKIIEWFPKHIRVQLYNERTGRKQDIVVEKSLAAIIENPFYAVMNEPNSVAKRLVAKLNILDAIDQQSGAGKLDIIIQLPYLVKTKSRQAQAEQRRKDIEDQLANSKFGIAYADATERITQLNRPVDNDLLKQITYLTEMLYSQLGFTEGILNGTADSQTMVFYQTRTVQAVLTALTESMSKKFLTKTARTQKQSIIFINEPFKLLSAGDLAEVADKMTRNEIMSSNEFRSILGYKPDKDPKSDKLENKNISSKANGVDKPEIREVEATDDEKEV